MRDQNHRRAMTQGILDRGQSFADASVVDDATVFERHVEVNPHEHAVIAERKIANGKLRHDGRP